MNKKMTACAAFVCSLFGMLSAGLAAYIFFMATASMKQAGMGRILTLSFVSIVTCAYAVTVLNKRYDKDEVPAVKPGVPRWTRTLFFACLVTCFMMALMCTSVKAVQEGRTLNLAFRTILILSCGIASGMYQLNYKKMMPRSKRIDFMCGEFVMNKGRRFTLVAEEFLTDGKRVVVRGNVHGEVHSGDKIWIRYGTQPSCGAKIVNLEQNGKRVHSVKEAQADVMLNIKLEDREKFSLYQYAVLSSAIPFYRARGVITAENPGIAGLLMEFAKHKGDPAYRSLVNYEILHSHFLVAGMTEKGDSTSHTGDIMDCLEHNTNVQFPGVFMNGSPDKSYLAVFTDWDALKRWKSCMKEERACTMIADFDQVNSIVAKGFKGAALNPFGPCSFLMTEEILETLRNLDVYKEEKIKEIKENE